MYNPKIRGDNKWGPRKKVTIVRVFPRYFTIPPQYFDKWVNFCFSELILYEPFHNVERDIGHDDDTIVVNWDSFNYNPWHVQRQEHAQNDEPSSDSKMEDNRAILENTIEHECEIISRLHRGQHMPVSKIDTCWEGEILIEIQIGAMNIKLKRRQSEQ